MVEVDGGELVLVGLLVEEPEEGGLAGTGGPGDEDQLVGVEGEIGGRDEGDRVLLIEAEAEHGGGLEDAGGGLGRSGADGVLEVHGG